MLLNSLSGQRANLAPRTATNGTYEGIAIGGDRYPGTSFIDHLLRYEADPNCKLLVLLGEVGGVEEYRVIEAVKSGAIKKPIVAWAIGTCAKMFTTAVQFGHAGSMANSDLETADAKNNAMRAAGFIVPPTFEDLPDVLKATYDKLVAAGSIVPKPEVLPPTIPMDYKWAQELGMVRKETAFISCVCFWTAMLLPEPRLTHSFHANRTISDERGQELLYSGMRISDVFKEDIGIGGVVSLLWFKRRLPAYATKFLEMVLMLTADHGPAVSGAMTTVITTRAGKDLVSSLVAGLLTIGDRFGGALDGAAAEFSRAKDLGLSPREFVDSMRKANKLIPGIGHKIKSKTNPVRFAFLRSFIGLALTRVRVIRTSASSSSRRTSRSTSPSRPSSTTPSPSRTSPRPRRTPSSSTSTDASLSCVSHRAPCPGPPTDSPRPNSASLTSFARLAPSPPRRLTST